VCADDCTDMAVVPIYAVHVYPFLRIGFSSLRKMQNQGIHTQYLYLYPDYRLEFCSQNYETVEDFKFVFAFCGFFLRYSYCSVNSYNIIGPL
jgi:hypothetical protein